MSYASTSLLTVLVVLLAIQVPVKDLGIGDSYPLSKCIVSDQALDEGAEIFSDSGREFRVCCKDCQQQFIVSQYNFATRIDEQLLKQQQPFYPLATCLVDDKPLGGAALDFLFRNRLFRVCGPKCQGAVENEPAKYFGKLDWAVIEKQRPTYPLDKCLVSGERLGDSALDHVVANQLVRLADARHLERFGQTPGKYLDRLREARQQVQKKP